LRPFPGFSLRSVWAEAQTYLFSSWRALDVPRFALRKSGLKPDLPFKNVVAGLERESSGSSFQAA